MNQYENGWKTGNILAPWLAIPIALTYPLPNFLGIDLALLYVLFVVCCAATIFDLRFHRIPNALCYSSLAVVASLHLMTLLTPGAVSEEALHRLVDAMMGFAVCIALTGTAWKMGAIGGGDVKLCSLLGAILGGVAGVWILLLAHLLAACFYVGVVVLAATRLAGTEWVAARGSQLVIKKDGQSYIPMAGFYSAAVALTLATVWF